MLALNRATKSHETPLSSFAYYADPVLHDSYSPLGLNRLGARVGRADVGLADGNHATTVGCVVGCTDELVGAPVVALVLADVPLGVGLAVGLAVGLLPS